jgi:NADH-quinone oxidoreductase subunit L
MAYMNLFMFSMIVLVLSDSLPATFLGWEGVGLCSYLLIGFWHHDHANNDAARKAFVVNRIGDLGFLLGAFALYMLMGHEGSLNYQAIAAWFKDAENAAGAKQSVLLVAATALLFLGCTGKSAQIPLLTWLPDAMAGPTPVSALIHAATMVTSGVYLAARLCDVFVLAPDVMNMIAIIGCATAVYGAIAGLVQNDIKKVLAYSTISQLGFMFMAVGVGAFDVALFHVFTHAFFKATLFLSAGSVIHALHHEQDMRRMGGLAKLLPLTYACMWFGWYAIIGLPFASGYMSKDLILERLFEAPGGEVIGMIALATALLTAVYMTRLMYLTFWSPSRLSDEARAHVHESPFTMMLPLMILGVGSIVAGLVWPASLPLAASKLQNLSSESPGTLQEFLLPVLAHAQITMNAHVYEQHEFHWTMPILGVLAGVFGLLIARWLWLKGPEAGAATQPELRGFASIWTKLFDQIYEEAIAKPMYLLSALLARIIDQGVVANAAKGIASISYLLSDGYVLLQRSRLRVSLIFSFIGVIVLVVTLLWDLL